LSFRVLGPHERGRFAPEAWGEILALSRSGAVSPAEVEQLIERMEATIRSRFPELSRVFVRPVSDS